MADTIKCKVIGTQEIDGVAPGGFAELDPQMVNIRALIEAGLVEVVGNVDVSELPRPTPDRVVYQPHNRPGRAVRRGAGDAAPPGRS